MTTTLLVSPYALGTTDPAGDAAFTFTGTNGDPWPSPWVSSPGGAGALADIQGNRGRMVTGTAQSAYLASRAFYGSATYGDFDVVARLAFANPKVTQLCSIVVHGDSWHSSGYDLPTNGYVVQVSAGGNTLSIIEVNAGAWGTNANVTKTFTAGTDVWFKVNVTGARIRGRVWDVGATEPATWDVDHTDTVSPITSGKWGFSSAAQDPNIACYWDDVTFSVAQTTGPYAHIGSDALTLTDTVGENLTSSGNPLRWASGTDIQWASGTSLAWGA